MTPQRIQRKRSRGWKMPPDTIYVGRPTKYGNDWTPKKYWDAGYTGSFEVAIGHCVDAYRAWIEGRPHWAHGELRPVPDLSVLRGKDLACWCPPGQRCHGDVLLELANRDDNREMSQ
jgi:hypothetical protein